MSTTPCSPFEPGSPVDVDWTLSTDARLVRRVLTRAVAATLGPIADRLPGIPLAAAFVKK